MPDEPEPLELAARALRHRDRSKAEVDRRLARAGVDESHRLQALERLEQIGYVDDRRYAAGRVEALSTRGLGDAAIRHDLETHGVGGEDVEAALAAVEPEAQRALALAERLGRSPKTAAQLARKGFGAEAIEAAVGCEIATGEG